MSDSRCRPVPPELQELTRECVEALGLKAASQAIGLAPSTLTSVLAGFDVMPGTVAILADFRRRTAVSRSRFGADIIAANLDPRGEF